MKFCSMFLRPERCRSMKGKIDPHHGYVALGFILVRHRFTAAIFGTGPMLEAWLTTTFPGGPRPRSRAASP
jgi:hypothetical protein